MVSICAQEGRKFLLSAPTVIDLVGQKRSHTKNPSLK